MTDSVRIPARCLATPQGLLATGFGSGLAPVAPGTFGSAAALPFYLLMADLPLAIYLGVTIGVFVVGIWAAQRLSDDLGVHDHGGIVIDEFVGVFIALAACPGQWPGGWQGGWPGSWTGSWVWVAAGWLLFRLFDIVKPPPIGWLDRRVSGGFGIMIDDVLAGVYALVVIQIAARVVGAG